MQRKYGRLLWHDEKHKKYNVKPVLRMIGAPLTPKDINRDNSLIIDQGVEGSCVGHGLAGVIARGNNAVNNVTHEMATEIYFTGQHNDPWEGGAYKGANPFYEGCTTSAGCKAVIIMGYAGGFCWSFTLEDFLIGLSYFDSAAIGVNWYYGMENTDANGFIWSTGKIVGGHCVCIDELKIEQSPYGQLDENFSYVAGPNSWGYKWGVNGRFKMTLATLRKLLHENGEACFLLGRRSEPLTKPW